jgi:ABC-type spermidine/putrescine transport system permease subunit II
VGGGVFVALFVTFESVVRQEMVADRATMWRVTLIALLVAALSGGLIAFFLTMKDQVKRRLLRGERVNPLIRAYLGMGIWSLLLWCPTVFFLGILLIIVTH